MLTPSLTEFVPNNFGLRPKLLISIWTVEWPINEASWNETAGFNNTWMLLSRKIHTAGSVVENDIDETLESNRMGIVF